MVNESRDESGVRHRRPDFSRRSPVVAAKLAERRQKGEGGSPTVPVADMIERIGTDAEGADMRKLNWGIIGCGDVVEKKSGPSILQAENSRIVAVMRRDARKARAFAEAHGIRLCTDSADALLDLPEIDVVYVATPPSAHREYVLAAAARGRHVLVEKPMGLVTAQDDDMIAACDDAGVELFVAYYRRFHPHVAKMRELIGQDAIGRPVLARIDYAQPPAPDTAWGGGWRVRPEISGGGLFVDVVSHRLDALFSVLGAPAEVTGCRGAFLPGSNVEDAVALSLRCENGALCSVCGEFATGRSADGFMIVGTEGVIEADRLDSHAFTLRRGDEVREFAFERDPAPHLGLIRHIERVLAGEEPNASSGRDGRLTDWVLDQALGRNR